MTTRQIIHMVVNDKEKGTPSVVSRLRRRHVYRALLTARSAALESYRRRFKTISLFNYVTLSCVNVVETSFHECDCVPVKGCSIYKVDCKLAASFGLQDSGITDVTTIDGSERFSHIEFNRIAYIGGNKWAKKKYYCVKNNYIYIITDMELSKVSVRLLPDDPSTVLNCGCTKTGTKGCDSPLDQEFPLDANLEEDVIRRAKAILFGFNTPEDKTHNYVDDTQSPSATS